MKTIAQSVRNTCITYIFYSIFFYETPLGFESNNKQRFFEEIDILIDIKVIEVIKVIKVIDIKISIWYLNWY